MATLAFKPYTYKPTPPRSKSAATRPKPASEQASILNKLQHIISSGASVSAPWAAADDGGYRPGIRGTGTVYGGSDKANNDENADDRDLPTIEELLFTNLQGQGCTTGDRGLGKTSGVEEVAVDERGSSVDQSRSPQSDDSGGSPDDPIVLLGDDDSSASAAEADDVSLGTESTELDAGLFDSLEIAIDSTTPAPPRSSDGWHDIDDFPETAPRLQLAEQGASTPDSLPPHTPSSHLSSGLLHDGISIEGRCAGIKVLTSLGLPPCHTTGPADNQFSRGDQFHTGRGLADEHGLPELAANAFPIDERAAREQQEVEQDEGNREDDGPQQEMNDAAEWVGGPKSTNRRQSLSTPEPCHSDAGSRNSGGDSDDEQNTSDSAEDEEESYPIKRKQMSFNSAKWDEDDEETRPTKRRRPFLSPDDSMYKKPKHRLERTSTHQHKPHSKSYRRSPMSRSQHDQGSRVTTVSGTKGRLPSPAQTIDTQMPFDDTNLERPSRDNLPTLIEVTFRPHSLHRVSFTAVVRDGCNCQGVSFGQLRQLIESIGHTGKIDDLTIKSIKQDSFLLTGLSRSTSSLVSSGSTAVSVAAEPSPTYRKKATRIRSQHSSIINTASRTSHEADMYGSDSDSEPGSDGSGRVSEAEEGQSSPRQRKNRRWSDLEDFRLRAYMKEEKPWPWIFRKFPGRTSSAITQHWKILTQQGDK